MREIILVKYGEMALKGANRSTFEDVLLRNIRFRLKRLGSFSYAKAQSTIYIVPEAESDDACAALVGAAMPRLKKIFGIAALARARACEKDFSDIAAQAVPYLHDALTAAKTFKVEAKRADKAFPMKSPQICAELGGVLLKAYPHLRVNVTEPDVTVTVEIRDRNAYIHAAREKGAGGLPVGTAGNALLLLSGGIDSPVAAYMMAKRGLRITACHFASPPYTSERARLKVEQLCEKLTPWCGSIAFYCVPFTEIQEELERSCPEEYFTILMRRLMMEIAQEIAKREDCGAVVTGESLGQVASQTLQAIACTDAVSKMPVLRPLIGMDKVEIIDISRRIDTYETSIQPYEDCCTVFTPRHPKLRPVLSEVEEVQAAVDFAPMVARAVAETEKKVFALHIAEEQGSVTL
ncbi:MAG: tRNA 4-thiouridine(8) synthase ThiI [Oscillospiraceae bacterium]|nr:tRNA 4-thiouridine(8) synthase ThiI [Oscillospiraceae bacterium]